MKIYTIAATAFFLLFYSSGLSQMDTAIVFERTETEATYPGGNQGWKNFLTKNLNAMVPIDHGAAAGIYTVVVQFIVGTDGKARDFKALTNEGYGMEAEVIRILKIAGDWEPAVQNKRKVNAYRKQPVTFQVLDDNFNLSTYYVVEDTDTPITVSVDKVKNEDVKVSLSRGSITPAGDGKFILHVTGSERVVLTLFNKKKNKPIGIASLFVKPKS